MRSLGVGIVGAGPVTQAIHLPTLARLADDYSVVHVMDVDSRIAESVAGRAGARWSTSVEELLADPTVDVVAICSPHKFHAEQVIAAIDAGARGILCEKPFAISSAEAEMLASVATNSGTPLLVGAMHSYDPAWMAVQSEWGDLVQTAHTVRSSIVLPPNSRFEDWATGILIRPERRAAPDFSDPETMASSYRDGILALSIHNVPLIRMFAPVIERVSDPEALTPYGYAVSVEGGGRQVELFGYVHGQWDARWTLEVWAPDALLQVTFTPSYVQSGSAIARVTANGQTRKIGPFPDNGYVEEWRRLARMVRGEKQRPEELQAFIDDLGYALRIAREAPLPAVAYATGVSG